MDALGFEGDPKEVGELAWDMYRQYGAFEPEAVAAAEIAHAFCPTLRLVPIDPEQS